MFFEDLAKFNDREIAVGWLARGHHFTRGLVAPEITEHIQRLCQQPAASIPSVPDGMPITF